MKILSTKELASKYELTAKKSLGQNFIFDSNLTDKIAKSANINLDDIVIEIGPGPGGLTRSILNLNPSRLVVIEQDSRCVEALRELKESLDDKFDIIEGDALKCNLVDIASKFKIIANLPYNIATVLLFNWLEYNENISSLTLMFQKEVAARIFAKPRTKDYGRLAVMVQSFCDVKHIFDIPPEAFTPQPKVTSSVIQITPHNKNEDIDKNKLSLLCKTAFGQRRKYLKSTIKSLIPDIENRLVELDVNNQARPEELTINQLCKLTKYIN